MSECSCNCRCGGVKSVSTELTMKDRVGALKVRCGIGRMNYNIDPGLYSVGDPDDTSPILVSANYKLTFDSLRKELTGLDCYILILDTKGVNVWCAAGKGTFGTDELIRSIVSVGLGMITSQRKLILPQLGAPGISAHEVRKRTGFEVIYGPVRASDIKEFLNAGMKATDEMRTVKFTTRDRTVLTPIEFVAAMKIMLFVLGAVFLLDLTLERPFGMNDAIAYFGAAFMGTVAVPILLPVIPGRAFSLKGWIAGLCWTVFAVWMFGWLQNDPITAAGYLLVLPSLSAYHAMNFTGSSTFTSLSGVEKEIKGAFPVILATGIIGITVLLIGKVI